MWTENECKGSQRAQTNSERSSESLTIAGKSGSLEATYKEVRCGLRLVHSPIFYFFKVQVFTKDRSRMRHFKNYPNY